MHAHVNADTLDYAVELPVLSGFTRRAVDSILGLDTLYSLSIVTSDASTVCIQADWGWGKPVVIPYWLVHLFSHCKPLEHSAVFLRKWAKFLNQASVSLNPFVPVFGQLVARTVVTDRQTDRQAYKPRPVTPCCAWFNNGAGAARNVWHSYHCFPLTVHVLIKVEHMYICSPVGRGIVCYCV